MATPESQAFTQCYPTLVECIQNSPNDVAVQLKHYPILAPQDTQYLKNSTHDDGDKARRILDSVDSQLKINKVAFHQFLAALKKSGSFTTNTVKELEETFKRISPPTSVSVPDSNDLSIANLQSNTGVTDAQLDNELVTRNLQVLARCFGNFRAYLDILELTDGNQATVVAAAREEDNDGAMREALKLWIKRNPGAATYRALVNILLQLGKGDEARKVCFHVVREIAKIITN